MTLLELRTLTLQWLDDVNAGYFTTTTVNSWINNAQKEAQKRLLKAGQNYYLKCKESQLVVNQSEYVLPSDFRKLNRLEVVISNHGTTSEAKQPIIPITLNQQDFVGVGPGTPRGYFLKKNRLVFWPAPDQTLFIRLYYSYMVADMVNDVDVPDVPEPYHEYLALLAAQDGFLKDGRVPDLILKRISEYESQLDSDANERLLDMPRSIVEVGNDYDYGLMW